MSGKLGVAEGLEIQAEHVRQWARVLNPLAFKRLCDFVKAENEKLNLAKDSGFDVCRGQELTGFVCNMTINGY